MNMVESFLNSDLIYALGWTLIHSIWQILLIGITLKVLLTLYKNHSSNLKYSLSVSAFYLILIASAITFISYINLDNSTKYAVYNSISTEFSEVQLNQSDLSKHSYISGQTFISNIGELISTNIQFVVGVWLAGLFVFYFRMAGSYWYVHRLKTRNLFPIDDEWDIQIKDLAQKLQINKIIRIAQSTTIKIPMVIGHLKPVILLPIGLMSSLPYNQVEAILLHELAHVKRNDYLVNLIKSIVEVLFFYHPVLWWVSSKIDEEREHCCDDLTIQVSSQKSALQKALLNIQKLNINTNKPTYIAAALFKNKHQLLKRIKRMKTQNFSNQSKFNGFKATFILLMSLAILATFSAFSPTSSDLPMDYHNYGTNTMDFPKAIEEPVNHLDLNDQSFQSENIKISTIIPDSTKKDKKEVDKDIDKDVDRDIDKITDQDIDIEEELEKELEQVQKKLEEAQIEMNRASEVYGKVMEEYSETLAKTVDFENLTTWSVIEAEHANAVALAELHLEEMDIVIPEIDEMRIAEILEEHLADIEIWSIDEHIDMPHNLMEESIELHELEEKLHSAEMIEHLELIEDQLEIQMEELEEVLAHQLEELGDVKELEFEAQLLESTIKSELIKDGLIKNKKDDLSFILSAKKLEINGKAQSKELHQKYLELYEDITDEKLEGTTKLIFQD